MKNLLIGVTLGALTIIVGLGIRTARAQSSVAFFGSDPSSTSANCTIPATPSGWTWFCGTGDGKIYVSIKGAPYVLYGGGTVGPAGPAGATGPAGPAGPQGPAGTIPAGVVTSVNGHVGPVVTLAIN